MTTEIMQELDQYSDEPRFSKSAQDKLSVEAAEQFIADAGDEYFPTPRNWSYISGWLSSQTVPITRRNLMIAFRCLSAARMLETRLDDSLTTIEGPLDRGIKRVRSTDTVVLRGFTEAERQIVSEHPERAAEVLGPKFQERMAEDASNREMAGAPGQRISPQFRTKFKRSLGINRRASQQTRLGEARAFIALNNPDLDSRSQEFNRLVAELMKEVLG